MLIRDIFVGEPSASVKQWIIEQSGTYKSEWDKLVDKLESFNQYLSPQTQGLPQIGSEITTKYMICDGYMNNETFVQCLTKASVMENIDKIDSVDLAWIVLGYNGTVPQYVKYKNGKNYIYVSSVDDTVAEYGFLRPIAAGCKTYSRSWSNDTLRNVFTNTGKTVASVGNDTFTYGQTNIYCGTTATTAGGYSVPMTISVNGITYAFCGYTMTLQTKYLLGSSKDGATITESTCAFSYTNAGESTRTRWSDSHIRIFLNSRCGHNEITYPRWTPIGVNNMLEFTNGIGLKLAKELDFLKCCPPTIARNWVHISYRDDGAQLDSNHVEHTANDFILPGSANLNVNDNGKLFGNEYEDFAIFSSIYSDETYANDNTYKSEKLKKKTIIDINGNPGNNVEAWQIKSAFRSSAIVIPKVATLGYVFYTSNIVRFSPMCSIY